MKITRRQLRRIIKEATQPMTSDYVKKQMAGKGARTGAMFMDTALDAVAAGDLQAAANAVMDGLWIDDPPQSKPKMISQLLQLIGVLSISGVDNENFKETTSSTNP